MPIQFYVHINPFLNIYSFQDIEEKALGIIVEKMKLLRMSNITFFHNVFYANCILKSFNINISAVFCSFFEFGMVSKWCISEWVNTVSWSTL